MTQADAQLVLGEGGRQRTRCPAEQNAEADRRDEDAQQEAQARADSRADPSVPIGRLDHLRMPLGVLGDQGRGTQLQTVLDPLLQLVEVGAGSLEIGVRSNENLLMVIVHEPIVTQVTPRG